MSTTEIGSNQPISQPPIEPNYSFRSRSWSAAKALGGCIIVILTGGAALLSSTLRSSISRNWKILTGSVDSLVVQKTDHVFHAIVSQPTTKKPESEVRSEKLRDLLNGEGHDQALNEIYSNRENLRNNVVRFIDDPKSKHGQQQMMFGIKPTIYNYINGISDLNNKPLDIAIPSENYQPYYNEILDSTRGTNNIKIQIQGSKARLESLPKNDRQIILQPWDYFLQKNMEEFNALPNEHQIFLKETTISTYYGTEEQMKSQELENKLKNALEDKQKIFFENCIEHADKQNSVYRSFIHFEPNHFDREVCLERIYIRMNKENAVRFVNKIIPELFSKNPQAPESSKYPGIIDIKVVCPKEAGRTDGIVIYIGHKKNSAITSDEAQKNAENQRNAIVEKLKEIQQKDPDFFGTNDMPFKKKEAPGIATIPGLSSSDSFTEDISYAIAHVVSEPGQLENVTAFKEKVMDAYARKLWER